MKVIVCSDIHDNWSNLDRFIIQAEEQEDIKTVICCGDVSAPDTLKKLTDGLSDKKVYVVYGNVDGDKRADKEIESSSNNLQIIFDEVGELDLNSKKIAFCHKPDKAKELASTGNYDIVFYGHTHKPWEEKIGKTVMLNPGELTYFFYEPTYAIYDLAKMEGKLVLLNRGPEMLK